MKKISLQELKRHLSRFISEASAGASIIVTRHRRPVVRLTSAQLEHVNVGARFGEGTLAPAVRSGSGARGRYLEVLEDDRRGGPEK